MAMSNKQQQRVERTALYIACLLRAVEERNVAVDINDLCGTLIPAFADVEEYTHDQVCELERVLASEGFFG